MFAVMGRAKPGRNGHVLRNPVDPTSFMGMLCFKNGSLVREEVRDRCCGGDWGRFTELLKQRPPGNGGALGFYFASPEITPTTGDRSGVSRFDAAGNAVESFDDATEVRAVVEGKFLAMRHFGQGIGMDPAEVRRIIATGGASANTGVLQVLADVFGVPVYTLEQSDSASLGAAFRACHGHRCHEDASGFVPFAEVLSAGRGEADADVAISYCEAAQPRPNAREEYGALLERFAALQEALLEKLRQPQETPAKQRKLDTAEP